MRLEVGKKYGWEQHGHRKTHEDVLITIVEQFGNLYIGEYGPNKQRYIFNSVGNCCGKAGYGTFTPFNLINVKKKIEFTLVLASGYAHGFTSKYSDIVSDNLYLVKTDDDYYGQKLMKCEELRKYILANS